MNKFGTIKSKILQSLTESYSKQNKEQIKEIITTIKKDQNFKEMYLFYEEIENKYIENPADATLYLEEILPFLLDKSRVINETCMLLEKKIGNVQIVENELYNNLDIFMERRKLGNIDKKMEAKKNLIKHLTTKKETPTLEESTFTGNENLLQAVLTNNFNVLYSNTLTEEEKVELKTILSISESDLISNFSDLQSEVGTKMNKMLTEEKNEDLRNKINAALTDAYNMKPTKYNYYKLQQLKNGL
jgi:hypothetical protein